MTLYTGLKPRFASYVTFVLKPSTIVLAFAYFIGMARMVFVVYSYMMKMALMPFMDRMGKFPVKSAYTVPFFLSTNPMLRNS